MHTESAARAPITPDESFKAGAQSASLLLFAASAGHWFITPMNHPDASMVERIAVWAMLLGGAGGSVWITRSHRRRIARQARGE